MTIQQAILQIPIVDPNTGMLTEYGRQLISDNLIGTANKNSSEIESNIQLSTTSDATPSYKASEQDLPSVIPFVEPDVEGTIAALTQEILRLKQRVEDLENGS